MRSYSRLRRNGKRVFFIWLVAEVIGAALMFAFGSSWSQDLLSPGHKTYNSKPSLEQRMEDAQAYIREHPSPITKPGSPQPPPPPPYTPPGPWDPPPDPGYARDPVLSKFATLVAMRKAFIECPTWEEWSIDFIATDGVLGYTYPDFWNFAVVGFDEGLSLCAAARALGREGSARGEEEEPWTDSTLALAALVVIHESYHLRSSWASHRSERRVQCKAIRHFKVTVRLLGGSEALATRLLPYGLSWHRAIARIPEYNDPRCVLPKL